ncbi:MAG: NAD(P)/FAD-dependent oxidoreductase [Acidimicrobiales bacterium]
MRSPLPESADAVVVGGGTIGGWCAWFLKRAGLRSVAVVERGHLGSGASSRAAGMVRAQGGTEVAVRLGMWSRDFYSRQQDEIGVDSGFVTQGYFMPAFDEGEAKIAHDRLEMQHSAGLGEAVWLGRSEAEALNPTLRRGICLGGTYAPGDGWLDAPRNVLAYGVALALAGVEVHEHTTFRGLYCEGGGLCAVETDAGVVRAPRVVLTGGPDIAEVGELCGVRVHAGGTRHQVAVTEPRPELRAEVLGPMVFDIAEGLYWRPEDGGLLFGMSNPAEPPGPAREVDWDYLEKMRDRVAELVPVTEGLSMRRVWAATMDYTADHLPILGPALGPGGAALAGVTVASAGGHGMMWGPAVARVAADLALGLDTSVADVSMLGLDRFDSDGRSRLETDPIALPFPERTVT